jgi:quinolinate synthase
MLGSQPQPVDVAAAIQAEKEKLNAVILAHYYQIDEIQDVADFIGDSLDLARKAAATDADVIVFCGVHFMAETAKILSPEKLVLLPDLEAGCSLAESAPADAFARFCTEHPDHVVVTYVNSSAAVKALSDYCVTSSNAVDVVRSIPADKAILFAPDQYLASWVAQEAGRQLTIWEGSCEVHELFSVSAIAELKQAHPEAQVLVHPECPPGVRQFADVIGSTKKLLAAVENGAADACYLVVTEPGIIHQMKRIAPSATFIEAPSDAAPSQDGSCANCNTCPHMKRNTLDKLLACLQRKSPSIELEPTLIERAKLPIERMLAIG